jgi:hypothetical protein
MPEHGSLRQANVVWAAANPDAAPPQIRLDLPAPERYRSLRPGVTAPFDQHESQKTITLGDRERLN